MATALQTRSDAAQLLAAPSQDERTDGILRFCVSGSYREFGVLMMFNVPDPDQRQALVARQNALLESLKHERGKIRLLIGEMLEGYRHRGVKPGEDSTKVIDLYVRELALDPKIPTWAVWRACGAIRLGTDTARLDEAGIKLYEAPTTMSMRRLCDSFVWEVRAELGKIGDVLRGKKARREPSPEERAAVGAKFAALAAEMKDRLQNDAPDGPPPLSEADLIHLAGGEKAFAAIPDAKVAPHKGAVGALAEKVMAGTG